MSLIELVYISAATRPMRDAELDQLLSKSRINNALVDLTGILIHDNGSFLQVLEGEPNEVDRLFTTISKDPRHLKVKVLSRQSVAVRTFGNWRMGFVKVNQTPGRQLTGQFDPTQDWQSQEELATDSRALFFVRGFREGKWRSLIDGR